MTKLDPGQWHHVLATWLRIKPGDALHLLRIGKLPAEGASRADVEACLSLFDTDRAAFARDLRNLAAELRTFGREFSLPAGQRYGGMLAPTTPGVPFYPVTRYGKAWRDHRAPVSEPEYMAACDRHHALFRIGMTLAASYALFGEQMAAVIEEADRPIPAWARELIDLPAAIETEQPTARLRALQVGESVLLPQYQSTRQISAYVARLAAEGFCFSSCAEAGGVRVTRLARLEREQQP